MSPIWGSHHKISYNIEPITDIDLGDDEDE